MLSPCGYHILLFCHPFVPARPVYSTRMSHLPSIDTPELHEISELRILRLLSKLNLSKASGPDEVPNWLLKEYADFLTFPVSKIINASPKEQCLPHIWKLADVTPLPKRKPVRDLKKDLRPISLTACLSKVAEECVVSDYVKPAVLRVLDPNQYGAVPNSRYNSSSDSHDSPMGTRD